MIDIASVPNSEQGRWLYSLDSLSEHTTQLHEKSSEGASEAETSDHRFDLLSKSDRKENLDWSNKAWTTLSLWLSVYLRRPPTVTDRQAAEFAELLSSEARSLKDTTGTVAVCSNGSQTAF